MDQAFKDVQRCATLEPRNQNFQETLRRLNASIQEKVSPVHKPWLPPSIPGKDMLEKQGIRARLVLVNTWHRQVPQNS